MWTDFFGGQVIKESSEKYRVPRCSTIRLRRNNSASRFTANSKLSACGPPSADYRKNLEFALRTLFTTFSEISKIKLDKLIFYVLND